MRDQHRRGRGLVVSAMPTGAASRPATVATHVVTKKANCAVEQARADQRRRQIGDRGLCGDAPNDGRSPGAARRAPYCEQQQDHCKTRRLGHPDLEHEQVERCGRQRGQRQHDDQDRGRVATEHLKGGGGHGSFVLVGDELHCCGRPPDRASASFWFRGYRIRGTRTHTTTEPGTPRAPRAPHRPTGIRSERTDLTSQSPTKLIGSRLDHWGVTTLCTPIGRQTRPGCPTLRCRNAASSW
ncbi:hypothetical protein BH23ACT10_BH23ACT10_08090 [soil metagenome]